MSVTKKRSAEGGESFDRKKKIPKREWHAEGETAAAADPKKKPFDPKSNNKFQKGVKTFNKPSTGPGGYKGKNPKAVFNKFSVKPAGANKFDKIKTEGATTTSEKTDWNKLKKDKKELRLKRKQKSDLFELTVQGKKIYEKLKCKGTKEKDVLARELHSLLRGENNYQKLVLAHDTARVVQCLLKYAPSEIRREISENLVPIVVQMATSKYAHFCVSRMIKYGTPDIKQQVIDAMYRSVMKMVNHAHSSTIIDTIYISWASSQQKAAMRQEFYGDLYKKSKDSTVKCISDTYKESPHMKLAILNSVKANLNHIVNKKLVDNSLVHAVLMEFLTECTDEDKGEITAAFSPFIPSLASTKEGVRASMIFFWNSIVKDRRAIVKSLKEHLVKLCCHEHGHVLILAIINSMDDTKALKKAIFDQLFSQIELIVSNEWGRKIIEWFVAPEDTSLFHPKIIAFLEEGLKFSKKEKNVRRAELFEAVEEPLCKAIVSNPNFWLRGGHTGLATAAILKNAKGDNSKLAYDKLAEVICHPEWKVCPKEIEEKTEEEKTKEANTKKINKKAKVVIKEEEKVITDQKNLETVFGVEHAGLHIVLKKIIKSDKEKLEANQPTFSASIVEHLTNESIEVWLKMNRSSFLILNCFENGDEATCSALKEKIASHKKLLKSQNHAAAKLIFKKFEF